ncbi:MAG TPA: hypothetical protein VJS44_04700 [Pyrinomonadaceae bacterium]|nr:hypothetical protein [Pyrinomonadaceae bacterium]
MKYWLSVLPLAMAMVGGYLVGRDANTTGGDDEMGTLLTEISPDMPQVISGNEKATEKVMRVMYRISGSYLKRRNALPAE